MIIAPNSTVWLCSGVPFDMGYNHTKLYPNKTDQFADIVTRSIGYYQNCTYVRPGKLRVTCAMSQAYKVDYLIYNNTSFENKYFYAFVTDCKYINNEVTEFTFETDVIQTYMFDYLFRYVFVDREHIANDEIGASLTDEGLESGDFIVCKQLVDSVSRNFKICIVTTFIMHKVSGENGVQTIYNTSPIKMRGKTASGLYLNTFNTVDEANSFLDQVVSDAKTDGIVTAYMVPSAMSDYDVVTRDITLYPFNSSNTPGDNEMKEGNLFETYVPKNKKLYQYPYRFVRVLNGRGNVGIYKWEESNYYSFSNRNPILKFREFIGGYSNPEIILSCFTNGFNAGDTPNPANMMTNGGAVPISFSTDAYKAWLAQNQGQLQYLDTHRVLTLARGVFNSGAGATYSNGIPSSNSTALAIPGDIASTSMGSFAQNAQPRGSYSVQGSVGTAVNTLIDWGDQVARKMALLQDKSVMPPESHVVTTSGQLAQDSGLAGFTLQCCSIRREFAEVIDNYFTMYGYAVRKIKLPNLHTRQSFNYIKTTGCLITGQMPADDKITIQRIYDKGITFWHTTLANVGNYSLYNGSVT